MLFELYSNTNVIFIVDSGSEIFVQPKEFTNAVNKYFPPHSLVKRFKVLDSLNSIHPIGRVAVKLRLGKFVLGDAGAKKL